MLKLRKKVLRAAILHKKYLYPILMELLTVQNTSNGTREPSTKTRFLELVEEA